MIRISKGPMLETYAQLYCVPIAEVIDWVSSYVNGPWTDAQERFGIEPDEKERLDSIKQYITNQIKNHITTRIKEKSHEPEQSSLESSEKGPEDHQSLSATALRNYQLAETYLRTERKGARYKENTKTGGEGARRIRHGDGLQPLGGLF